MEREELAETVEAILHPEPDPDATPQEWPHERLERVHSLDVSYLKTINWEGSSLHEHTRVCEQATGERLRALMHNQDGPHALFVAALDLLGQSILSYHGDRERKGRLRFYPSILMTCWAGLEAFVRYQSELLTITAPALSPTVRDYLLEREETVDRLGKVVVRERWNPVLYRYATLLRHGYDYVPDRGARIWQALEKSKDLRDSYVHLDIQESRALGTAEVCDAFEAVLLGLIGPSCAIRRTVLLGVYDLHYVLTELRPLAEEYSEQPFFHDWPMDETFTFHCNFNRVDEQQFPSASLFADKLKATRTAPE